VNWKTVVFNFNYDHLDKIKTFAESKGAIFHAEKTHRYGNDSFVPPESYIETNHLYQEEFNNQSFEIEPRCEKDAKVITADGFLYPCDWIRNPQTFYKSQLWKQKQRWLEKTKMKDNTYDQVLSVIRDWEDYVRQSSLDQSGNIDVLCKMLCRKDCVANNKIELS
jgi:MoaA/NifB/PqqE/SkfB family radical SAM enzyme